MRVEDLPEIFLFSIGDSVSTFLHVRLCSWHEDSFQRRVLYYGRPVQIPGTVIYKALSDAAM